MADNVFEVDSGNTPQSTLARRRLAEAMLKMGMDVSPVQSWTQGAARMLNSALGGYDLGQLEAEDKADRTKARDFASGSLGIPSAAPAGVPSAMPPAAGGAAKTPSEAVPGGEDFMAWVKQKEGFNPKPYKDYSQTSIGYGTKAQPGDENGITQEEALKRLNVEMGQSRQLVQSWAADNKVKLSPKQEDAMSDLTFNSGTKWMNAGLAAALKSGNLPVAAQLFSQYVNAGGVPEKGLITRRKELAPWLLDTTPGAAPGPLETLIPPGIGAGMPPGMPDLSGRGPSPAQPPMLTPAAPALPGGLQGGPAPMAPVAPAAVLGAPTPVAPQLPPGAVGPPAAGPSAAGPVANPPVQRGDINAQAWAALGPRAAVVQAALTTSDPNSPTYKMALAEFSQARDRLLAAAQPVEPMKQAELAYKQAQTAAEQVKAGEGPAATRKLTAEANLAEKKDSAMPSRDETLARIQKTLTAARAIPTDYGREAFERATGKFTGGTLDEQGPAGMGSALISAGRAVVGAIPNAVAEARAAVNGGARPGEVQDALAQLQTDLLSALRPYAKGSGSESDKDTQILKDLVGNLAKSNGVEDFDRRLDRVLATAERITMRNASPDALRNVKRDEMGGGEGLTRSANAPELTGREKAMAQLKAMGITPGMSPDEIMKRAAPLMGRFAQPSTAPPAGQLEGELSSAWQKLDPQWPKLPQMDDATRQRLMEIMLQGGGGVL